jgi:RNA polymerase sigma-70 factor (ECF subfamily)
MASEHEQEEGSKALAALLKVYRPALRQYLRYRFHSLREEVDDWISGFISQKILEQHLLKRAREDKGRFRNYLLTALYRFAEDERRAAHRGRRRPVGGLVSLDATHECSAAQSSNHEPNPGDLHWAKTVLDRARKQTEGHYRAKGREATWEVFVAGCYNPLRHGESRPSDAELARRHGFKSARQVSNQIGLVKKLFGEALRDVIREYEQSEAGVDEEIRELVAILSGGRSVD